MITIKDIAASAGVSKSTVSRVLTNSGYVSEKTRLRIMEEIRRTGFQPCASARHLSTQTTRTIGIVVPEIGNPFYTEVLAGISDVVDEEDLTIIYCNTDNDHDKEFKAFETLLRQRVLGMVVASAGDYENPDALRRLRQILKQLDAPVVFLDRAVEGLGMDSVMYDNYGAGHAAAEALINAGNQRIGMITGDMQLAIARERCRGFREAMQEHGLEVKPRDIYPGDFSMETAYALSCSMLDSPDHPDAVITSNNQSTLGFLRALRERGMHLCRDIAMVGIDHIEALDIIDYRYSYVTRDTREMGKTAMRMLLARIREPQRPVRAVIVPYQVVLKGTERRIGP